LQSEAHRYARSTLDLDFLRETKTAMWISLGESVGPHLIEAFARLAIPIRQNYSSEEVGMIRAAKFPVTITLRRATSWSRLSIGVMSSAA
jgi:hypothetical protein